MECEPKLGVCGGDASDPPVDQSTKSPNLICAGLEGFWDVDSEFGGELSGEAWCSRGHVCELPGTVAVAVCALSGTVTEAVGAPPNTAAVVAPAAH